MLTGATHVTTLSMTIDEVKKNNDVLKTPTRRHRHSRSTELDWTEQIEDYRMR